MTENTKYTLWVVNPGLVAQRAYCYFLTALYYYPFSICLIMAATCENEKNIILVNSVLSILGAFNSSF
jgi:hypothetical protein